mgnify:FL=1
MSDFGNAYYPGDSDPLSKGVPTGRYSSRIVDLEVTTNLRFGKYVADVFKPEYAIDGMQHPEYSDSCVLDNGIFRYKEKEGFLYDPKKNWGYVKFISFFGLYKKNSKGVQLPVISLPDIKSSNILIDVFMKSFTNEYEKEIKYPVARAIQLLSDKALF